MQFEFVGTDWGDFAYVAGARGLVATYLPGPRHQIERQIRARYPGATEGTQVLPSFKAEIVDYFKQSPVRFTAAVDLTDVPPFYRRVLEACRRIPYGQTASYADLARAVGNPAAARAVGGAMRTNRLPLVIPCHRVLRSGGGLGGFSAPRGVVVKHRLLQHENPAFGQGGTGRGRLCATAA